MVLNKDNTVAATVSTISLCTTVSTACTGVSAASVASTELWWIFVMCYEFFWPSILFIRQQQQQQQQQLSPQTNLWRNPKDRKLNNRKINSETELLSETELHDAGLKPAAPILDRITWIFQWWFGNSKLHLFTLHSFCACVSFLNFQIALLSLLLHSFSHHASQVSTKHKFQRSGKYGRNIYIIYSQWRYFEDWSIFGKILQKKPVVYIKYSCDVTHHTHTPCHHIIHLNS